MLGVVRFSIRFQQVSLCRVQKRGDNIASKIRLGFNGKNVRKTGNARERSCAPTRGSHGTIYQQRKAAEYFIRRII